MMKDIIVSIVCTSFNHEKYIRQALDGFVSQITDFKFEIIMHDDASTDGTVGIIKEYVSLYPDLFVPVFQAENQYSKGVNIWELCFSKARGKYIAICEGDDYWIDPYKLQKQVDFLENNPDYTLVYGKIKQLIVETDELQDASWISDKSDFKDLLLKGNCIPTLSVCLRTTILEEYETCIRTNPNWQMGDYPLWIIASYLGKCKFIDEYFGVYRVLNSSASHFLTYNQSFSFHLSAYSIALFFANRYNVLKQVKKQAQFNLFRYMVKICLFYKGADYHQYFSLLDRRCCLVYLFLIKINELSNRLLLRI